jgi:hypothetical protein
MEQPYDHTVMTWLHHGVPHGTSYDNWEGDVASVSNELAQIDIRHMEKIDQ